MLPQQDSHYLQPSGYTRRNSGFIDREFQLKYTRYLLWMSGLIALVFLLPPFYYCFQNYGIFIRLADLNDPRLAHFLISERFYLVVYFGVAALAQFGFWIVFSRRMSAKIVGPAKLLRNHIRLVSRGDFSLPALRIRDDDEFKDLIGSYNYFYSLLKTQYERELEDLNNLKKMTTNAGALDLIKEMTEVRAKRLGQIPLNPNDLANSLEGPATSRDSRHAS